MRLFTYIRQVNVCVLTVMFLSYSMIGQTTEKGLFWKMESPNGHVSYLFGTMHTDDNRVTDFSSTITDALKSVDLFVMETQPNNDPENIVMQDASLETMLTEAELDQLRVLTDFHVMHSHKVLKMKPWLLAIVFSQSKPQTPYAQDSLLRYGAQGFKKPVEGLETSQEHFAVIDDFSLEEQLTMLRAALKRTQEQKERDFERLMAVYLGGDSDKILALDAEITSATLSQSLWKKLRVKLLDERNVLMAQRAVEKATKQSVFVAVGASHLAGENGFINAFKKAGFTLKPIKQ